MKNNNTSYSLYYGNYILINLLIINIQYSLRRIYNKKKNINAHK